LAKRTRYNNRKIIAREQTLPISKVLPGMIVTFNYSEDGITDPRPIVLFLHHDLKANTIEGLNLNYIDPSKIKKLFSIIEFKKGKLDEDENLVHLKENYFRIQISNSKKRSPLTTKRFYGDIIKADNRFIESYRKYKISKLSALKVTTLNLKFIGVPTQEFEGDVVKLSEGVYQDSAGRWRDTETKRYVKIRPDQS